MQKRIKRIIIIERSRKVKSIDLQGMNALHCYGTIPSNVARVLNSVGKRLGFFCLVSPGRSHSLFQKAFLCLLFILCRFLSQWFCSRLGGNARGTYCAHIIAHAVRNEQYIFNQRGDFCAEFGQVAGKCVFFASERRGMIQTGNLTRDGSDQVRDDVRGGSDSSDKNRRESGKPLSPLLFGFSCKTEITSKSCR